MVAAVELPTAIQPTRSLSDNVRLLLQGRLARELDAAETARLQEALREALSVLQAGNDASLQRILAADLATALYSPGAAQLWACAVEAAESETGSVAAYCAEVTNAAGTIAGALFASALGRDISP